MRELLFTWSIRNQAVQMSKYSIAQIYRNLGNCVLVQSHNATLSTQRVAPQCRTKEARYRVGYKKKLSADSTDQSHQSGQFAYQLRQLPRGFRLPSDPPNPRLPSQAVLTPKVMEMLNGIEKVTLIGSLNFTLSITTQPIFQKRFRNVIDH